LWEGVGLVGVGPDVAISIKTLGLPERHRFILSLLLAGEKRG